MSRITIHFAKWFRTFLALSTLMPFVAFASLVGNWSVSFPDLSPQGGGHPCSVPGLVDISGINQVKLKSFSSFFSCTGETDGMSLRPTLVYYSVAQESGFFSFDWSAHVDYIDPRAQANIGYGNVPGEVALVSDYVLALQGTSGHVSAFVQQGDNMKFYLQTPDLGFGAAFLEINNFIGPGGEKIEIAEPETLVLVLVGLILLAMYSQSIRRIGRLRS